MTGDSTMNEIPTASFLLFLTLGSSQHALSEQQSTGLVYTKFAESGAEIWRVDTDGANDRKIGSGADATWSPDGAHLAFTKDVDGNVDVYLMNADGGNLRRLTSDIAAEHSPTWSPDGSMIAFNSDRSGSDQIWRTNVESGNWGYNLTQLTEDTHHNRVNNFISWSPDGLWIAFEADRDRDDPEIYLANSVDGTNQQRLTYTRALDEVPSWSPSGKEILFSSDMHDAPQSGTYDIYIMNVDGSSQRRLTTTLGAASYPSMSKDGGKIVYSYQASEEGSSDIWIMNFDGSHPRVLVKGGSIPRFSPF
jgi:TolB protein